MRRFAAVAAVIIAAVLTSGCAADEFSGNTQQSYSGASAEYSADSVEYSAEAAAEYSAPTAEPQASAAPTVESAAVDPVRLAEGLSAEFLGLPDSGKVYIFRDKKESVTINGAEYFGVTCLDEEDGRLESICDIYISPDGATAYRYHPEDGSYRLLPEQGEFPGFDPESQSPEDVFRQANALCAAVYGELDFDSTAEPVTFAAEDGRLYCLEHYGGAASPALEYSLAELTEDTAVYSCTALYEYEAGSTTRQDFTCTARRDRQGKWRFTDFTYPGK